MVLVERPVPEFARGALVEEDLVADLLERDDLRALGELLDGARGPVVAEEVVVGCGLAFADVGAGDS